MLSCWTKQIIEGKKKYSFQTGTCSHQSAYKYFAESVRSDQPLAGQFCGSLQALKDEKCYDTDEQTILGGEPGALPGTQ